MIPHSQPAQGISTNVCKKGRGRPKKLNDETLAVLKQIFPDKCSYRDYCKVYKWTFVLKTLREATGEGHVADGPKALARWPWLLRPNKEQWTVLSVLYEIRSMDDIVGVADVLEQAHRESHINAKRAIEVIRLVVREVKTANGEHPLGCTYGAYAHLSN